MQEEKQKKKKNFPHTPFIEKEENEKKKEQSRAVCAYAHDEDGVPIKGRRKRKKKGFSFPRTPFLFQRRKERKKKWRLPDTRA